MRPLPPPPTKDQTFSFNWRQWLAFLYEIGLNTAGYGGGRQVSGIALNIPTVTYNTLPFDTASPSVERGVTFDLPNNSFSFGRAGVWTMMVNMSIQGHNSDNGGRQFFARLYNETTATAGNGMVIGVGRNVTDTQFSTTFLVEISQTTVENAHTFRVEVGNADTAITGGTLIAGGVQTTFEG